MQKSKRLKARIYISGATIQNIYGFEHRKDSLHKKAREALTNWEPRTAANLFPEYYEILEHVRTIDGKTAEWKAIERVNYGDIPQDQLAWKRRKAERALRDKLTPEQEEAKRLKDKQDTITNTTAPFDIVLTTFPALLKFFGGSLPEPMQESIKLLREMRGKVIAELEKQL